MLKTSTFIKVQCFVKLHDLILKLTLLSIPVLYSEDTTTVLLAHTTEVVSSSLDDILHYKDHRAVDNLLYHIDDKPKILL